MHRYHNQSSWNERLFAGKIDDWYRWYLLERGLSHCAINSLFFLTTMTEKYAKMCERFINDVDEVLRYLDYNSNHPISAKLSDVRTLIHRAKQVCSTPEFLAKEMDHLHKVLQDIWYLTQFFQQSKPKQKANKKPTPSTGKFIE